ncbi:MAG: contractile injection system protein, VgrG/Pvc8 family [Ferribacterium limneticum]
MLDPRALLKTEPHPRAVVELTVDGVSLTSIIRQRLIQLTHTDNRGFEADTVEIELDDTDGKLDLPPRGAIITLALGWAARGLVPKGTYTVDEVAHRGAPDTMSIRARSADMAAGLTTQRERSWHNITLGALIQTIAIENDLKSSIHGSYFAIVIDHLDQTNESAANLLTRLAQMHDAIATVKNGVLLFTPAGAGVTASGKRIPAVTINRQSGDSHDFTLADRQTYQAVIAHHHDIGGAIKGKVTWGDIEDSAERGKLPVQTAAATGQHKALTKTSPTRAKALRAARLAWQALKKNKAARAAYVGVKAKYDDRNLNVSGEVTYGQSDDDKKQTAAQKKAAADAGKPGSTNAFERTADNAKTLRHVYSSRANALRAARAEWRRLQRGMATFSIAKAEGDPTLFPETPATVRGFKPQIDSTDWIITRVTNTLTADAGYTQRIEFEIKATEIPD